MRPVFLFVAVVLLIAGPAQANNTPRNFLFDAQYLEILRLGYETYRGNGVDSATVDTNGTAGTQTTFDDPANSNYKWAQIALWALVETEDNRKKNPHWYKSIDVQFAIDYYERSATEWDNDPKNLPLPAGQKLVGADEVTGLQNLAKTMADDLADIREYSSSFDDQADDEVYSEIASVWKDDTLRFPKRPVTSTLASYKSHIDAVLDIVLGAAQKQGVKFKFDNRLRWDAYKRMSMKAKRSLDSSAKAETDSKILQAAGSNASTDQKQRAARLAAGRSTIVGQYLNADAATVDPVRFLASIPSGGGALVTDFREVKKTEDPTKKAGDPGKGK